MNNDINIKLVTFTCDYDITGSNGTVKYFKLRDQMFANGPIKVLVDYDKIVNMYKYVEGDEFWLLPDDIVVSGDNLIPDSRKSMLKWYKEKYWIDWSGDIRGLVLALEGIDIHGKVEHNGQALWEEIQKVSPNVNVKFNASERVCLEQVEYDGNAVYIIKR
jgi:hypothetical protein